MDEATVRKAFEDNYLGGNKQTARRNEYGDYVLPSIQDAWAGWRAAHEQTWHVIKTANVQGNRPPRDHVAED